MPVKLCLLAVVIFIGTAWSYCPGQQKSGSTRSPTAADNSKLTRLRTAHQLVERAKNFEDLQTKTTTLIRLATLLWQHAGEERYARQIFVGVHDELKLAAASQSQLPSPTSRTNIPRLQQMVARALSRFDSKLAAEWFEENLVGDANTNAARRLDFAIDLASEGNSSDAVRFAQSAVDTAFSNLDLRMVLTLLHRVRAVDQPGADSLFLNILSRVSAQPRLKADELLLIGNYLFIQDTDATPDNVRYTGVRVAGLYFPVGISGERTGLARQLVKAYLQAALTVLNHQLNDTSTQFPKRYEATARMLLEKAQKFAPELVPAFTALARDFGVSAISNAPFPSAESTVKAVNYDEVAPQLEKLQGTARDERALALIATAYLQNDLETASKLADWITNDTHRTLVGELILFRKGSNYLEKEDGSNAERITSQLKIPELVVLLQLGLAQLDIKKRQATSALRHLQLAQKQLQDHEISGEGLHLLNTAALFVKIDPNTALEVFERAASSLDGSPRGIAELTNRDHLSKIQVGKTSVFFALDSPAIPFGNLEDCIVALFRHSQGQVLPTLLRLKNEKILGPTLVAVAKELLVKKSSSSLRPQHNVIAQY